MNLIWRLVLGIALVAALAGLCVWDARLDHPCFVLLPTAVVVASLAADELLTLAAKRGLRPARLPTIAATALVVASSGVVVYWPASGESYPRDCPIGTLGWPLSTAAVALVGTFLVELRRYREPGQSIANLGAAALCLLYVGVFASFLIHLRLLDLGAGGMLPLLSLIAVVKACDIGAYTVGRLTGRHKMSPAVSPGKTWEGAAGGVAFACAASLGIFSALGDNRLNVTGPLIYGAIVGITGMFGDLAESLLKRDAEQKDSSTWMPGFGGVLDIMDSILFAAPVAYLLWASGIVRP